MAYSKKALADYLRTVLANTTDDVPGVDKSLPHMVLGGAGSQVTLSSKNGPSFVAKMPDEGAPTLVIFGDGVEAFRAFVDECLKDAEFESKIGRSATSRQLKQLIRELHGTNHQELDLEDIVKKEVLQALRKMIHNWVVRVAIANLVVNDSLTIGDVTLVSHEMGIANNMRFLVNWDFGDDEELAARSLAAPLKMVSEFARQGKAWAIVEVESHKDRAAEVAREKVDRAVNAVRAFTHHFTPHDMRVGFGLPHEVHVGHTGYVCVSDEEFAIHHESGFASFTLSSEVLKRLRDELSFDEIARIAGSEWNDLNSLEQAIQVSMKWLGRSVIALSHSEALAYCTIAIERLLIIDGEQSTTERFADRLAYLLSDEQAIRKVIHSTAKRLYDIRSRIVHAGFQAVELGQLARMENFAIGALLKVVLLVSQLKDHESLRELLHDRKME